MLNLKPRGTNKGRIACFTPPIEGGIVRDLRDGDKVTVLNSFYVSSVTL